jgi:hypothetical protein
MRIKDKLLVTIRANSTEWPDHQVYGNPKTDDSVYVWNSCSNSLIMQVVLKDFPFNEKWAHGHLM